MAPKRTRKDPRSPAKTTASDEDDENDNDDESGNALDTLLASMPSVRVCMAY